MTLLHDSQHHTYDEYAESLLHSFNKQIPLTDTNINSINPADWNNINKYDIFRSNNTLYDITNSNMYSSITNQQLLLESAGHHINQDQSNDSVQLHITNNNNNHTGSLNKQLINILTWKSNQLLHSTPINLAELDSDQFIELYQYHFQSLLIDKQQQSLANIFDDKGLSVAALYVLQGIESNHIQYNASTCAYELTHPTNHCINKLLYEFMGYGTLYKHMELICEYIQDNYRAYGSILFGYSESLLYWLTLYRHKLLPLYNNQLSIIQLYTVTQPLLLQLRAVYHITLQHNVTVFNVQHIVDRLPKKTLLITYLYNQCQRLSIQDSYNLYTSIQYMFDCCLNSYINILSSWLYYGKCIDPHNEFFNDNTATNNNKPINTNSILLNIPVFLQHIADILFLTGQSLYVMSHADTALFYACAINTTSPATQQPVSAQHLLQLQYNDTNMKQQFIIRNLVRKQQQDALDNYIVQLRNQLQQSIEHRLSRTQQLIQQRRLYTYIHDTNHELIIQHKLQLHKQQQYLCELNEQIALNQQKKSIERQTIEQSELQLQQQYQLQQQHRITVEHNRLLEEHNIIMLAESKKQQLVQWKLKRLALNSKRAGILYNDELMSERQTINAGTNHDGHNSILIDGVNDVVDTGHIELLLDGDELNNDTSDDIVAEVIIDTVDIDNVQLNIQSPARIKSTPTVPHGDNTIDPPSNAINPSAQHDTNRVNQMKSNIFNVNENTTSSFIDQPIKSYISIDKHTLEENMSRVSVQRVSPLDAARQAIAPISNISTITPDITASQSVQQQKYTVNTDTTSDNHTSLSLQSIIQNTLISSVLAQYASVNRAVLTLYNTQLHLLQHVQTCRGYLLWANGDISQYISNELCDTMKYNRSIQWNNISYHSLKSIIDDGLKYCNTVNTEYTELLYFKPSNYIAQNTNKLTQSHVLHDMDGIVLSYRVAWPLSLVITEDSIQQYNRVWSYLLRVYRVHSKLTNIFKLFQSAEKQLYTYKLQQSILGRQQISNNHNNDIDQHTIHLHSHRLRTLQTVRHEMQHLHSVILQHTLNEILERSWNTYIYNMSNNVNNLRDLCTVHDGYIDSILKQCYLQPDV